MYKVIRCCVLLLVLAVTGCGAVKPSINVSGVAKDAKAGAVVITDEGGTYYIDRLDYWGPEYLNKRVNVTGILQTVVHTPERLGKQKSEITGTQNIIKHAQFELAR